MLGASRISKTLVRAGHTMQWFSVYLAYMRPCIQSPVQGRRGRGEGAEKERGRRGRERRGEGRKGREGRKEDRQGEKEGRKRDEESEKCSARLVISKPGWSVPLDSRTVGPHLVCSAASYSAVCR